MRNLSLSGGVFASFSCFSCVLFLPLWRWTVVVGGDDTFGRDVRGGCA